MRRWRAFAAGVLALALASGAGAGAVSPPLDEHRLAVAAYGNDAPWYENNIPFFEASAPELQAVWYYRWKLFRAHQRDLGSRGYITTEFLGDVGWQREPYASLNDASAFHVAEGRWLRDRRYVADYLDFLYAGGGNDRHFSEAIADAAWGRYLADGDRTAALAHLDAMKHVYNLWDDHFDFTKGLYWIEPLLDATEYTIASIDASGGRDGFTGGHAFRPSINSYMVANARAIARLSALAGDEATAADYGARADRLAATMNDALWSPSLVHYIDRYRIQNDHVRYWQPIRGRELVGYLPWTFGIAPDDATRAQAWRHLLSPAELGGRAGPRTVEPSYPFYMRQYRTDAATGARECQWNGPSWPFQTTQMLTGMARLLADYHQTVVTRSNYVRLLRQYASLHYQGDRLDLEEDYDPDAGTPIVGLARSHHYNHSGFADLIVTGLAGLRPRDDDMLDVDPLVPADAADPQALRWFAVQDVPYHGHRVAILFDEDGRHYRQGRGLTLFVDGRQVAHSDTLRRLTVPLPRATPPPIARPVDLAVDLVRADYPRASASADADPERLHEAIDGRVWFFPQAPNGWSTSHDAWFTVDLGAESATRRAELAFYADGDRYAAPAGIRLQAWRAGRWRDLATGTVPAIANGITAMRWPEVRTARIRLLVRPVPGKAIRLVELKLF